MNALEIYEKAERISEPEERRRFLDDACGSDVVLRARVEAMLDIVDVPESFVQPVIGPPERGDPLVGSVLGGVSIVRIIAAGGMGRVYEGRQQKPRRPVAVKIIRPGITSPTMLKRFEYEAQVLARLRHPGIAQIHSVGTHEVDGQAVPYFVMEYIPNAKPLTKYADERSLSTHDRLDLFRKVCEAVAHGHQKGVIHRDLKPANVLVDSSGQPKVIDFGVARSTDSDLALTTMQTDVGALVGTLQYMSPEQFDADPHDLDVRLDVYALGVILYELLAGKPPYEVKQKAIYEVARVVREEDPTPLSSMNKTLRRDVAIIAGKCLQKDKNRRYSSATELAGDVGRYLAGEPITAAPPTFRDTVARLARRHRFGIITTGVIAVSLVVGLMVSTWQAIRMNLLHRHAEAARYRAEIAHQDAESARKETTEALYGALLGRASAESRSRTPGYRSAVFDFLKQARRLNPGDTHASQIRNEAMACLSDFVALPPVRADHMPLQQLPAISEGFPNLPQNKYKYVCPSYSGRFLSAVQVRQEDHILIWKKDLPEPSKLPCVLGLIHALSFSADDTVLAVGCEEGFILWSPETQKPLFWARGDVVRSVAIHPEGHLLATLSQAGRVEVWSLQSQRLVALFNGEGSGDWAHVSFSIDGTYLVLEQRGVSHGWRINGTPECVEFSGHRGGIPSIAFSPDGLLLASVSKDRQIKLWDTVTGVLHGTLAEHEDDAAEIQAVDFSPDGKLLATGDWQSVIRVWDVENKKVACKAFCLPGGKIWRVRFDPQNRFLLAAGWFGVQGWEIRHDDSGVTLTPFHWRYAGEVRDFSWLPTAEGYAAISATGGGGTLWHYSFGKPDVALANGRPFRLFSLQVCHDGRLLYPMGDRFVAWDFMSGRPARDPQLNLSECYASPDGRFLAAREHGAVNNPTKILDSSTGNEQGRLPGNSSAIWCMAWSPDGSKLAHGYADGRLVMWRLEEVRERLAELGLDMPSTATQGAARQRGIDAVHWAESLAAEKTRLRSPAMSACMHELVTRDPFFDFLPSSDSIAFLERARKRASSTLGDEHDLTLMIVNNLAWQLATAPKAEDRDPERAIALVESIVRVRESSASSLCVLGAARIAAIDSQAAIPILQRALQLVGKDDITSVRAELLLGRAYAATNQLDRAKASLESVLGLLQQDGWEDAQLLSMRDDLVLLLKAQTNGERVSD